MHWAIRRSRTHLFWYGLRPSIGYRGPIPSLPGPADLLLLPVLAGAAPLVLLAGAAGAGAAAAAAAGGAVGCCSTFLGSPIFSPFHGCTLRSRMMINLRDSVSRLLAVADHASTGSANALSTLHGVEHKVGELDHHVLVKFLALDLVVQLGGEHRLDKVLSIGEDDPVRAVVSQLSSPTSNPCSD